MPLPRAPVVRLTRRLFSTSLPRTHAACNKPARTRFAPSPTGFLHLGSLRTALFNYLLAKKTGGQFLLRIEDTDQKRTVPGAEEALYETLKWAGLKWDEGPDVGGPYGPYRQSERSALHQQHAEQLVKDGHAYRCFCTPERLSALAITRKRAGLSTDYDRTCLTVSPTVSSQRAADGESHVIRLKVPNQYPAFHDAVYGTVEFAENKKAHLLGSFEDPVLLKSDGLPTYHLANVVDDHFMEITHVLRATEWLPSTPKHVWLYECFGWKKPEFVHVGLLQNDQRGKLSKRNGDVFVSEYREKGYLPEALVNFVALLGWSHTKTEDMMTLEEMVQEFDIDRLTQGNQIVNFGKLDFLQKHHAAAAPQGGETEKAILERCEKFVAEKFGDKLETGATIPADYTLRILRSNIGSFITPDHFITQRSYFYRSPFIPPKSVTKLQKAYQNLNLTFAQLMERFFIRLDQVPKENWNYETLHKIVEMGAMEDRTRWNTKMKVARLLLAGGEAGPSLAMTMVILGKERTMKRIEVGEKVMMGEVRRIAVGGQKE